MNIKTLEELIGNTPLIKLQRQECGSNQIMVKLEGNNPAGSVKDRPAISMVLEAEKRGEIKPGDTLIEPTSGNTGIALAMVAAVRGYKMILLMPEKASEERRGAMRAYGAELILTPSDEGINGAIDRAIELEKAGKGVILDQFNNPDNPLSHYRGTGPEIWRDTDGKVSHFVAGMGTSGTIMGAGRYLREQKPDIKIIGVEPEEGTNIPGIRNIPRDDRKPRFFEEERIDRILPIPRKEADEMTRKLAEEEGIFCGISSGGIVAAALRICKEVENSLIVSIICDRGDRYLSTKVFG